MANERIEIETCAVGIPLPASGPCTYCAATRDEFCRMRDEFSPREIRENKRRAKLGLKVEV